LHSPDRVLKGVSGASAGAITAFFIALGATSKDMSELTAIVDSDHVLLEEDLVIGSKNWFTGQLVPKSEISDQVFAKLKDPLIVKTNQSVFSLFYDPPSPGVIKAVGKVGNESNKSGFVNIKVKRSIELDLSEASKIKKFAAQIGLMSLKAFLVDRLLIRGTISRIFPNYKEPSDTAPIQAIRAFLISRSLIQFVKLRTFKYQVTIGDVISDRDVALQNGKKIAQNAYSILFPSLPETLLGVLSTFALNKKGKKKNKRSNSGKLENNTSTSTNSNQSGNENEGEPTDLEMMLFNSSEDTKNYVYSAFFDKGVFTGLNVNRLMAAKMSYYLRINFGKIKSSQVCANMNFFDFVNLTGNDLRLAVTNLTQKQPALFSCFLTPNFPVIDAVAGSMSIPLAFKPSFFNGTVRLSKVIGTPNANGSLSLGREAEERPDSDHNKSYRGFFCDGGTLMNLPIHAFDYDGNETDYKKRVVEMKKNMIGIRNSGGLPLNELEDPLFYEDPLYKCYEKYDIMLEGTKNLNEKPDVVSNKDKMEIQYNWSGGYSPLLNNVGNIVGTLLYSMEEGQIRSLEELEATSNFFSYGIDTLDFAVGKHLLSFTHARAFIKMTILLGVDEDTIVNTAYFEYYAPHLSRISSLNELNSPLDQEAIIGIIRNYTKGLKQNMLSRSRSIYKVNE